MASEEMSDAVEKELDSPAATVERYGFSPRWLAVILGALLALATVAAWLAFFSGDRLPTIDQERFDAAQRLWKERGPASYELTVAVSEIEPAVYEVSVRNGEVESAKMNGTPLALRGRKSAWSVPGMFGTISVDLKHATDPIQVGPKDVNYVTPQGEFDPQFGYPVRYRRIQWGSDNEASWVVTKFEVVK